MSEEIDAATKTQGPEEKKNDSVILLGSGESAEMPETKATIDGWWVLEYRDIKSLVCCETEEEATQLFGQLHRIPSGDKIDIVPACGLPLPGDEAIHAVDRPMFKNDEGKLVAQSPLVFKSSVTAIPEWVEARKKLHESGAQ